MQSLVACMVAIAIAVASVGCTQGVAQEGDPDTDAENADNAGPDDAVEDAASRPVRYLALGDSYTIGEGLTDDASRWPMQLATALRAAGHRIDDPTIIARTGWTTADLLRALRRETGEYDFVTLMIGVNNQYQRRSKAGFRRELKELLAKAIGYAGGQPPNVVVTSIPDWGATPFATGSNRESIAADIDAFNAIIREEVAAIEGLRFVDVTPISRDLAKDRANLTPDGLHYSASGCAAYAKAVLPAANACPAFRPGENHGAPHSRATPDNRGASDGGDAKDDK